MWYKEKSDVRSITGKIRKLFSIAMREGGVNELTVSQITEGLKVEFDEVNVTNLSALLYQMKKSGELEKVAHGKYKWKGQ